MVLTWLRRQKFLFAVDFPDLRSHSLHPGLSPKRIRFVKQSFNSCSGLAGRTNRWELIFPEVDLFAAEIRVSFQKAR
jgi:hypothetical protein